MMKFTGTLTLGLGIVFGVPALTFGGGLPGSLKEALDETVRAIDVLSQVEKKLQVGAELPAGTVPALTEPAILDARGRDELLNRLRSEVGTLQAKVDRHASTASNATVGTEAPAGLYGPGLPAGVAPGSSVAEGTTPEVKSGSDATGNLNLAGISTGMNSNLRTALAMGSGSAETSTTTPPDGVKQGTTETQDPAYGNPTSQPTSSGQNTTTPSVGATPSGVAPKASPEGKGYSANPLRQAQACFRAKRYQQGLDLLIGAPKTAEVTYWKARLEEKLGNWNHAIELYTSLKDDVSAGEFAEQATEQLEFVIWQRDFAKKTETKGNSK